MILNINKVYIKPKWTKFTGSGSSGLTKDLDIGTAPRGRAQTAACMVGYFCINQYNDCQIGQVKFGEKIWRKQ